MRESIDLGHGVNYDGGAIGRIEEETIINEVGTLVISKLKALGDEALSVRPSSATSLGNSLSQRCTASNNFNPDIFVSLHANAGGGRGVEIYTYGGKNLEAAQRILDNIVALGFRNRGIKDGSKLYVIRNTIAPAMLIEICFVDTDDVDIYNKVGANAIADAIVKGLKGTTTQVNNQEESRPEGNAWICRLQEECNSQGFSNQIVDGFAGPNTLSGCPMVRYGARGNITKLIQERLISLGYNVSCGADGIFGNGTKQAVMQFQQDNGLSADGIVGRNTWRALLGL
ncbi:N-acetylmuramoyl-L-alanine amidase [Clostridium cadaveris]|uniref:N-acetylmuramoyl-L-alanine amidase n=1 Tax=Clostridium cadaveris TaxID=1529 RepID=UPI0025A48AD6|nr:N-acetylmuramoyl-L-alanine amidase [Clostridium cadaveris]MDM8313542.1 N-acetylmuramoyl-L-alanine amidase [Clostridium cadaveris]